MVNLRLKMYLKYLFSIPRTKYIKQFNKNRKKIIVALAADYGNLGDVAITYAQTKFLKMHFPEYDIIDFPIGKTFTELKSLKRACTNDDIITIVGGGNTGDMYDDIEYCRQFIISQFPNNKIISFPQTVDFCDTESGQNALKKAIKVYSKHKYLTLIAREKASFEKYQKYFKNNKSILMPDIVLSLNESLPEYKRQGIIICLRSDAEKKMDKSQEAALIELLKQKYEIKYYDTHINRGNLSIKEREAELKKIWTAFRKSELVITDRLHGMIFCAITKTPCIALDNSNHKISEVYNSWLKDFKFIKMIEERDLSVLEAIIEKLESCNVDSFFGVDLTEKFKVIS